MDGKSLTSPLRRVLRATLPVLALAAGLGTVPALAQSLPEALALAYGSNPELLAARAQLRATDELVPQARSGYLPQASMSGEIGRTRAESNLGTSVNTPKSVDLTVTQAIYRGGRTVAGISRAENVVQSQRANLLSTEQNVLLEAATAYLDVVRDTAVLELNVKNEQVLNRQLEASRDRFRVGEITRTDVSQAESRVARAVSDRILAEGQLNATRASFTRLVGRPPEALVQPQLTLALPTSLNETIELALANNPGVIATRFASAAADDGVDLVTGELLPTVSVSGSLSREWDRLGTNGVTDSAAIIARVSVPLYEGGGTTARVREAKHTANQRRIEVESSERQAREGAIRAWEGLVTSRASIQSRQAQVLSSEIALEGVRQEATVGSRTVLDVLDAEQELLDARVQLVRAQRDELVAAFQVLAATGQLTAGRLNLTVDVYDFEDHYNQVNTKLWGVSID